MKQQQKYTRRTALAAMAALGSLAIGPRLARGAAQHIDATPAASPTPISHPTGTDELILQIRVGGGFVPVDYLITEMPGFSLYGDGRVIFLGPQPEIYPPPALPNLRVLTLNEDGIQTVLREAETAGLLDGNQHYSNNSVADAPTTVFTVHAGGGTTVVSAYALGIGTFLIERDTDREALAKLVTFTERMIGLTEWLPPSAIAAPEDSYPIERIQVVVDLTTPPAPAPDVSGTPLPQPEMDWPLAIPLTAFGDPYDGPGSSDAARCGEVSGEDAATLLAAINQANSLTPWQNEGATYQILFRPLLPHEAPCQPYSLGIP